MTRRILGTALPVLALIASGCGSSDSKSDEEGSAKESEGARTACRAPATTKPTGLPAAFPIPGELVITQVRKDGPTNVVDGYWTSGLDEAYTEWKENVERAGYQVLFDEKEEHDSEISYRGSNRTGQIALRDDCTEDETTRVHITNRPA